MANILADVFTIGFNTAGLEKFETELKNNEKQLKFYEKTVKECNKELKELEKQGDTTSSIYKGVEADLESAKKEVDRFTKAIDVMKGKSEYQLLQLRKNFGKLLQTTAKLAFVATTVKKSLQFYEQAEQLDFLAQKTGIAADKLQELGNASSRFGGNTESTATSIENIRTNREAYTQAGIRIENDPSKTLENVARKMETLSNDRAKWDLANSLGIDEATTRMLIQGVEKYNATLKQGSKYKLYTKEDIQRMRDYRQIQQDIRMGLERMNGVLFKFLLPSITAVSKVIRHITDFAVRNPAWVKFAGVVLGIATALFAANAGLKLFRNGLKLFSIFLKSTMGGALIALTLVFLAFEDLYTFINGGDSIIGKLYKAWGFDLEILRVQVKQWADDMIAVFNNVMAIFDKTREHIAPSWEKEAKNNLKTSDEKTKEFQKSQEEYWKARTKAEKIKDPAKRAKALQSLEEKRAEQGNLILYGRASVGKINRNASNSVPAGAQSAYYNTQSQNANTTNNSRNIANTRNNNIKVDNINIQTQANNPRQVAQEVGYVMTSLDNAQRA